MIHGTYSQLLSTPHRLIPSLRTQHLHSGILNGAGEKPKTRLTLSTYLKCVFCSAQQPNYISLVILFFCSLRDYFTYSLPSSNHIFLLYYFISHNARASYFTKKMEAIREELYIFSPPNS